MVFKMKGSPMQRNFPGAFKKETRWQAIKRGVGEVRDAIKETITTGNTPQQNLDNYRLKKEKERLANQKKRQENWRKENQ